MLNTAALLDNSALLGVRAELARDFRNHRYERSANGLYFPESKLFVGGAFTRYVDDGDRKITPNIFTDEGLNDLLGVYFHQASGPTGHFVAPFSGDVEPASGLTAATFAATMTEFTNYTQSTRVAWAKDAVASKAIANAATPALFTMNTGGGTIWGAALATASAKGATTGKLPACAKFDDAEVLSAGSKLNVEYSIAAADAG